jgi:hypothetical protein
VVSTTIPAAYAEKGGRTAVMVAAAVAMVMKVTAFVAAIQLARQNQQQSRFYYL